MQTLFGGYSFSQVEGRGEQSGNHCPLQGEDEEHEEEVGKARVHSGQVQQEQGGCYAQHGDTHCVPSE